MQSINSISQSRVCRIIIIGSALTLLNAASMANSYTFTKIADTTGPFSGFAGGAGPDQGTPAINNDGAVAFWAGLDAGGSGIYTGSGGATSAMALTGATFSGFGRGLPAINSAGAVTFWASLTAGGHGVYKAGPGASTVASTAFMFTGINDAPSISGASAMVAFRADEIGTSGIYNGTGAIVPATIASGSSSISADGPSIGGGTTAWSGTVAGVTGVYAGAGGALTTIANTTGPLSGFGPFCAINSGGTVAFRATLDAGGSGIYSGAGGALTTIATTGATFTTLGTPAINASNTVAFRAINFLGVKAIHTGSGGATERVVGDGDVIGGLTINDVRSSRHALNDAGQIAFRASFTDGTSGIYRANPCHADVNGDHVVNVDDLLAVIAAWGAAGASAADVTGDGIVNVDDMLLVINAWGPCP